MLNTDIYGSLAEAEEYFSGRLHTDAWDDSTSSEKTKALLAARRLMDNLNYKGDKHAVWLYKQSVSAPSVKDSGDEAAYLAAIRQADATQPLEFPRGSDVIVPEVIRIAQYELAYNLLDGVDPQMELENLAVTGQGHADVRTQFDRAMLPIEHLVNLIPNPLAWSLIKPFLRDDHTLRLSRVS